MENLQVDNHSLEEGEDAFPVLMTLCVMQRAKNLNKSCYERKHIKSVITELKL